MRTVAAGAAATMRATSSTLATLYGPPVDAELAEKRRRVLELLDREGLDALVLRRPGNVAWYSGGGRTHIVATPEVGVADVVITRDGDEVVTAVNEASRLEA